MCDENHYFLTDSSFNSTTDMSMNFILSLNKVRIMMSATGDFVTRYIEEQKQLTLKKFKIEKDYNYIDKLYFYKSDKLIKSFINNASANDKIIYFCHSAKKAYELHSHFENSLFNCSIHNSQYSKYINQDRIKDMLEMEKFDNNILFTTNSMDNGVNIKDRSVKYIIADIDDFDVLIQCLGRKRTTDDTDKVTIFIKLRTNNQLGGKITQANKKISMAEYLLEHTSSEFLDMYPRKQDYSKITYDAKSEDGVNIIKKVNEIMYYKCKYDIELLDSIIELGECGYMEYVSDLLQQDKYLLYEKEQDNITLEDKMDKYVGVKMFKDDKKEFMNFIKKELFCGLKTRYGTVKLDTINGFLKDNNYPYVVESKKERSRQSENYNKHYWVVSKKIYNID